MDFDFDAIIASKAPGSLGDARVGEVVDGKAYIASGMSSYNGDIYPWIENGKFSYEMLGQDTLNGETVEKYLIPAGFKPGDFSRISDSDFFVSEK